MGSSRGRGSAREGLLAATMLQMSCCGYAVLPMLSQRELVLWASMASPSLVAPKRPACHAQRVRAVLIALKTALSPSSCRVEDTQACPYRFSLGLAFTRPFADVAIQFWVPGQDALQGHWPSYDAAQVVE